MVEVVGAKQSGAASMCMQVSENKDAMMCANTRLHVILKQKEQIVSQVKTLLTSSTLGSRQRKCQPPVEWAELVARESAQQ